MCNVIIRESCHCVVAVVIARLVSYVKAVNPRFIGSLFEIFGKKLALLEELISGAL